MKTCQIKQKIIKKTVLLFVIILIIVFIPSRYSNAKVGGVATPNILGKLNCTMPAGVDENAVADAAKAQIGTGMEIKTLDVTVGGKVNKIKCTDERGFMERKMD